MLKSLQLLLEMATVAKSPDSHLAVVEAVEAAKAVLRLSLLKSFGRPITARDESLPSDDEVEAGANVNACSCGLQDLPHAKHVEMDKGPRTDSAILRLRHHRAMLNQSQFANQNKVINRPLSTARIAGLEPVPSILTKRERGGRLVDISTERNFTSTTSDVDDHEDPLLEALFVVAYERRSNWVIRMFMPQLDCPACYGVVVLPTPTLTDTLHGIQHSVENLPPAAIAAEVAYIARPVLHVMLIRRFGWRSWRAWMAALITDIASRALLSRYDEQTDDERVERRKRMANLLLYLGRSPLFDVLLRVVIKRATSPLRAIPLVGGLVSSAISWITLLQQYWFYTSGS